jgi:tetratricopeptide (TPR) repeat protein
MRSALLLTIVVLGSGVAAASPKTRGDALNAEGQTHFKAKDYAGALDSFERAYAAYPSAGLLVNIGTTYRQLGRPIDAANAYQRYLDDPAAEEALAAQTAQLLAFLDTLAGRLTIVVDGDPDGDAEIQIGDAAWIPHAQAHLMRVAPGTFVVRARLGERTTEISGRVDAGESREVALTLATEPAAAIRRRLPAPDDELDPPPPPPRRSRALSFVTAGAGAVALATAVGLALRASSRYDDASAECGGDPSCPGGDVVRSRSLADSARADRLLSIGLGVVGVAAISIVVVGTF